MRNESVPCFVIRSPGPLSLISVRSWWEPSVARRFQHQLWIGLVVAAWTALYLWRGLAAHLSLQTNAYDLSIFDHALWSLADGQHGHVSFMGHSIFSHHFMPILYVLLPLHALVPSPVTLIVLQVVAVAVGGYLFYRIQQHVGVPPLIAGLLVLVFLLSRRSHSATVSFFYPESMQPALIFGCVLFWRQSRWAAYWLCAVLLLMTKEDAGLYLAPFALLMWLKERVNLRQAALTLGLCAIWIIVAVAIAIPGSRQASGLSRENPLLQDRFSTDGDIQAGAIVSRLWSARSASTVANLMLGAGLLPLGSALWLLPGVPGAAANMMASPESMQAALIGHYAFPVLPWVFIAAAHGMQWMRQRFPRGALVWCTMLLLATIVDSPAIRGISTTRIDVNATTARRQLQQHMRDGRVVWAQPNLVPHLPQTRSTYTLGEGVKPPSPPDAVALTKIGSLWPFTAADVDQQLDEWRRNPDYKEVSSGPAFIFHRR